MGKIETDHTGSGGGITLSSDGTSLLLDGTAVGGGGGDPDLYAANESSPTAQPSATGTNAVAIGNSAVASGANSFAAGTNEFNGGSIASGSGSVSLNGSRSSGPGSFAASVGNNSSSYGSSWYNCVALGSQARATNQHSVAIGKQASSTGTQSVAIGFSATAQHAASVSIGKSVSSTANNQISLGGTADTVRISSTYTLPTADGTANQVLTTDGSGAVTFATAGGGGADLYSANESSPSAQPSATGTNAVAIGDSSLAAGEKSFAAGDDATIGSSATSAVALGTAYAGGSDSFAAAINVNSSSYGAQGNFSISMGRYSKVSGSNSMAIGDGAQAFPHVGVVAVGFNAQATGQACNAFGNNTKATTMSSTALGSYSNGNSTGKIALSSQRFSTEGDSQTGITVMRRPTTDATPAYLTTRYQWNDATGQVILPNNSAYFFSGTIIAREQASSGTDVGAWEIKGAIRREANAASTVLIKSTIDDFNVPTGWVVALTADTTNGGLAITVTGAAATNIRWVATVNTSEVTY